MSEEQKDWIRSNFNVSTIITIMILIGGWVVFFATQRAALADHDRRILVIEAEIVPRSEHNAAARVEAEKEKMRDERMSNIERMLEQLLDRRVERN